ncbi:helix-turn-helix domain-containing protein [Actinacidiphila epipremni]|uniref:helix-turn-helix domain-containing protein n=1 Tax=Actinacidiphila epipremni TaxID=2053013 RepID=UPI002AFE181D|nr:helix-turn-helix transcriptional regulator [Actinacidiphila epipremni]
MGDNEEDLPGPSINQLAGEENVAVRIKLERDSRGWSTNALSDRLNAAGYEMNPSAVWRIENGQRRVTVDDALGFAEVFGISLANLVGPPRLAAHARAMELVEDIRRAYRASHMANLAAAQARDALDAYLDEHPDVREEAEAAASLAVAEELTGLPQPYQLRNRPSPNRKDTE